MSESYVEQRNGVYTVGGTRVSLDSVVYYSSAVGTRINRRRRP
jgi:hypothetical protein